MINVTKQAGKQGTVESLMEANDNVTVVTFISFTSVCLLNSTPTERCLCAALTETDGKLFTCQHP